ncbi:MAG: hypothetical protein H6945_02715 [Zoogloeaceae bacterium]|nr:hypothetical protein [Rhodocyclaceae bacterium]MCP5234640.1 hypothetical protein [Zoogloeaceae bacterium]
MWMSMRHLVVPPVRDPDVRDDHDATFIGIASQRNLLYIQVACLEMSSAGNDLDLITRTGSALQAGVVPAQPGRSIVKPSPVGTTTQCAADGRILARPARA